MPFQNRKKSFFRGFSIVRFREAILAILKLFLLKSMFFSLNFNRNLSPFKIECLCVFSMFLYFSLSGADFGPNESLNESFNESSNESFFLKA